MEETITEFIGHSLFKIQLDNEGYDLDILNKSILKIGRRFYSQIKDIELREIYSKTGFHLKSCIKISDFINEEF